MQVLAGQLMESKHQLLQARVEHLELDLGFKARREGGVPSARAEDWRAASKGKDSTCALRACSLL